MLCNHRLCRSRAEDMLLFCLFGLIILIVTIALHYGSTSPAWTLLECAGFIVGIICLLLSLISGIRWGLGHRQAVRVGEALGERIAKGHFKTAPSPFSKKK